MGRLGDVLVATSAVYQGAMGIVRTVSRMFSCITYSSTRYILPVHMNVMRAEIQGYQSLKHQCIAWVDIGEETQ